VPRLTVVRFLRSVRPYNRGEVAGVEPDVAEALIEAGAAERYTQTAAEVAAQRESDEGFYDRNPEQRPRMADRTITKGAPSAPEE